MRRLIAILVVLMSSSAYAAMDPYTLWMSATPISRLDWFLFNSTLLLTKSLKPDNPDSRYKAAMKALDVVAVDPSMNYDFASNGITLHLDVLSGKVATAEACKAVVEQTRNMFVYQGSSGYQFEAATVSSLGIFATLYVVTMMSTPSGLTNANAPRDLETHIATQLKVDVYLTGGDVKAISCSGPLVGTEVNLKIK